MRHINANDSNDNEVLDRLAANQQLKSFPALQAMKAQIAAEYAHYIDVRGNANALNSAIGLSDDLAKAIVAHYAGDLVDLRFIKLIRKVLSPRVCPMCGSPKSSQVDHVAPKDVYPEFAVFSLNLVPACDCNGVKGTAFRGAEEGERVLHPYFDEIMSERLVYVSLRGEHDFPTLQVEITLEYMTHPAVKYHVNKILKKTNVLNFAGELWSQLKDDPESLLFLDREFNAPVTDKDVTSAFFKLLNMKDREFGTPNNWFSMFYWGILCTAGDWAIEYVRRRVNELRAMKH